jgi:membrane-associated phospholipid phosphatase
MRLFFFLVICIQKPYGTLVCMILIECYLTAVSVCETRNYCNVGYPVVCYVNNQMLRAVRYNCLLKK